MSYPVDSMYGCRSSNLVDEQVQALDADRTDDVRRVTGRDLRLEDVGRDVVVEDLERDVGLVLVRRIVVERGDEVLLDLDLLRLTARAQTDEPADDLAAVGAGHAGVDGLRGEQRVGSGDGAALATAAADGAALGAVEAALPPQAAAMTAMTPTRAIKARGPDRDWFIAIDSSCARSSAISYLSLMRPSGWGPITLGSVPAGRRPAQGMRLPALEARRMSSVARITRRAIRSPRSMLSPSRWTISRPISSTG